MAKEEVQPSSTSTVDNSTVLIKSDEAEAESDLCKFLMWKAKDFLKRRIVKFKGEEQEEVLVDWEEYDVQTWEPVRLLSEDNKKKLPPDYQRRLPEEKKSNSEEKSNESEMMDDDQYEFEVGKSNRKLIFDL